MGVPSCDGSVNSGAKLPADGTESADKIAGFDVNITARSEMIHIRGVIYSSPVILTTPSQRDNKSKKDH